MTTLDAIDRVILNGLQGGFPVCERPFLEIAPRFGLTEMELIRRIESLLERGLLSRFGPLWDATRIGGAVTLAAIEVPAGEFERIAAIVNGFPEVAHNYEREHRLNLWFVLSVTDPARIADAIRRIEAATGLAVLEFPKLDEYFLELRLAA